MTFIKLLTQNAFFTVSNIKQELFATFQPFWLAASKDLEVRMTLSANMEVSKNLETPKGRTLADTMLDGLQGVKA